MPMTPMQEWWYDYRIKNGLNNTVARRQLVQDAWEAAMALRPEARDPWVSVKDRLPEKGQLIVIRWDDDTAENICDRYEAIEYMKWDENGVDWNCATHWMPVNEPLPQRETP